MLLIVMGAEGGESTWDQAKRQRGKVTRSFDSTVVASSRDLLEKTERMKYVGNEVIHITQIEHIQLRTHDWE